MDDLMLPVNEGDHTRGDPNAPITLLEYGDYECLHCGRAHDIVYRILEKTGNQVLFVFRNYPLLRIHPHAMQAALAAEAAGLQDRFWDMHDALFEHQDSLEDATILAIAEKLKLNVNQFVADMPSKEVEAKVLLDIDSGFRSGVYGTPTFFINGRRHDDSYQYDVLSKAVKSALKSPASQ